MKRLVLTSIIAVWLSPLHALAGEVGSVIKSSEVKATPFNDAKTVGTITKGAKVDILGRNGGWMQVSAGRTKGWTRMLNIRRGTSKASLDLAGAVQVASGRAATGNIASTTGIRGLSNEDLKKAPYSESQIKQLEGYTVSAEQAQQFANKARRAARNVDKLPDPGKV